MPLDRMHEPVRHEQLRDRVAVVGQVLVERRLDRPVRLLELEQHQRDAVDEQHHVGAAAVQLAGDPHLRRGQPVVLRRVVEVEIADGGEAAGRRGRPSTRLGSRRAAASWTSRFARIGSITERSLVTAASASSRVSSGTEPFSSRSASRRR